MILTASNSTYVGTQAFSSINNDFVIGFLSGVVSSVLVTIFFRYLDSRKEARMYLNQTANFIHRLDKIYHGFGPLTDTINETYDFLMENEWPERFRWIKLNAKEKALEKSFRESLKNFFGDIYNLSQIGNNNFNNEEKEQRMKAGKADAKKSWNAIYQYYKDVINYIGEK